MSSSCILWPTLCSVICLCQLPLSPPILHRSLKSSGTFSCDCRSPGLLSLHMVWSAPPALLVKTSLAFLPLCQCRVTLKVAAGWAAAMKNPLPSRHVHAWGLTATSAFTIGNGAKPAQHIHTTGCQRPSAGQSSSSSILSLSLAPLQSNNKLLGRCFPVIYFPLHWMGTTTCIWKISNLTSWLYFINERRVGAKIGKQVCDWGTRMFFV